jgi:FkbM family methyltransferase
MKATRKVFSTTRRSFMSFLGEERYRRLTQSFNALKRLLRPKHEPEIAYLKKLVGPGDTVFEIGANYGQYSRVLSKLVGTSGRIHAFEPASITYNLLVRNIHLLRLANVTPHRIALSDQIGSTELHTPIKREGVFGVAVASLGKDENLPTVSETVEMDTLDHFIDTHSVKNVTLLRCDVEGAEFSVLQGGKGVLTDFRPSILMEVHPSMLSRWGKSVKGLEKFFGDLSYEFFMLKDNNVTRLDDLPDDHDYNIFCLPSERNNLLH